MNTDGAPQARVWSAAVWTGSEMIIWGGSYETNLSSLCNNPIFNNGACYNPITDQWRPLSTNGAPPPSRQAVAVWTGTEMIVWGGYGAWS